MAILYLMIILSLIILFFSANLEAAQDLVSHVKISNQAGLEKILKQRYMRVLTTKNAFDYYIYQGKKKGIQYEMVKEFTKFLNKKYTKKGQLPIVFELVPVEFDQLIPLINEGKGDFIAVALTKTPIREKSLNFTIPYQSVDDVIVTRKELLHQNWREQTFHIQRNSSFKESLLKKKISIKEIDPNFNPADLLELIAEGNYDYTLVSSFWAKTVSKMFKNLAVIKQVPFRKKVGIRWALGKDNKALLKELNLFLPKVKKGTLLGNMFGMKYFSNISRIHAVNSNFKENKISDYDKIFKKYAAKYAMDWRLLAAVSYQESRFNQSIVNRWGAIGMMQIKQMTANEPYINIKDIKGPKKHDNNIHAGTKYLAWIKNRYFDKNKAMSEDDRFRMTLAAYNAGPARVRQAVKKARKMGLDPKKWFRHVELAMLRMGYSEPVYYVSEINKHYTSYVLLGITK